MGWGCFVYSPAYMVAEPEHADANPIPALVRSKFAVTRAFLWLVVKCTSLTGLYILGRFFGTCEWLVNYKRRRRFQRRMKQVFGKDYDRKEMRAACRSYFMRLRCDKFYYLVFDLLSKEKIIRRTHFPQRELIDASLARGRGVYIVMSHLGAHHVAALLMCFLDYEVAVVRDRNEGSLRRYIQQRLAHRFSEVRAAKMFFADAFPRDLYRWFGNNRLLGSALDSERVRESHLKRMPVKVFGETKEYLTGTIQIALRCKASIHQGFITSKPNFNYEMTVSPPLIDPDTSDDSPDVLQKLMQAYAGNIEAHTRQYPDHISRI